MFWRLISFLRTKLMEMNHKVFNKMKFKILLTALTAMTTSLSSAFTYSDTDLLLVFRKDGFNDVEFNVGSVSNYLGLANGTRIIVNNWSLTTVNANFNNNLAGVRFALAAATDTTNALRRVWSTSANLYPLTPVTDLAGSKWGQLRAKISTVGTEATNITSGSASQTFIAAPSDGSSYTFIVSEGGALDAATMGGSAPFPVESDQPATLLFYQLRVSNSNPKPAALLVGAFCLDAAGVLSFTSGPLLPLPQPTISLVRSGNVNTISFNTADCGNYRLHYTSDITGTWTTAATTVAGDGSTKTLTDTTGGVRRFYVVEAFR